MFPGLEIEVAVTKLMEKWPDHENFGEISVVDKVDGIMIRQGKGIKWLLF